MKTAVIAECGINHGGSIEKAKKMISSAKECGCSSVKFQTYLTEHRVNRDNPAFGTLKKCELSFAQQKELHEFAKYIGIDFFSTPFCTKALDFLVEDLGLRKIKLASFDLTNKNFLKAVNEYGKKYHNFNVIMSTGMANCNEIANAVDIFESVPYLTLLHCVSSYPMAEKDANLNRIKSLKYIVHGARKIGYSDHSRGILIPAMAVLLGAEVIEKHFTLDRKDGSIDNPVSADPNMMKSMINLIKVYENVLGSTEFQVLDSEKAALQFRRES